MSHSNDRELNDLMDVSLTARLNMLWITIGTDSGMRTRLISGLIPEARNTTAVRSSLTRPAHPA